MKFNLRLLYLYLFSFVGLLIVVIGSIQLVNLGLKVSVFKNVDTYEIYPSSQGKDGEPISETPEVIKARQERETTRQRQRELINSVSMIVVGLPLYLYHWKTIQKESRTKKA